MFSANNSLFLLVISKSVKGAALGLRNDGAYNYPHSFVKPLRLLKFPFLLKAYKNQVWWCTLPQCTPLTSPLSYVDTYSFTAETNNLCLNISNLRVDAGGSANVDRYFGSRYSYLSTWNWIIFLKVNLTGQVSPARRGPSRKAMSMMFN